MFDYRTAIRALNRALADAAIVMNTIKALARWLKNIASKNKIVSEALVCRCFTIRDDGWGGERNWHRNRSMMQHLLSSYVRRKWCIQSVTSEPNPSWIPNQTVHHRPSPSDLSPTRLQELDGQHPRNLDVTMAKSTNKFGNTMCRDDLDGEAVTLPLCVANVPILADIAKANWMSSGILGCYIRLQHGYFWS